MKCVEFRRWLINRDPVVERPGDRVESHLKECPICRRLYRMDTRLNAVLAGALGKTVELPRGLLDKVEMNLRCLEEGCGAFGRRRMYLMAAAIVLVLAASAVVVLYPFREPIKSIDELGRLAVHNHLSHLAVMFTANDVEDVPDWFAERLDFRVVPPDTGVSNLSLVGGRKCTLGGEDAACLFYRDNRNDNRVSVFVMDSDALGFDAEDMRRYRLRVKHRDVTFWKSGELAYVMVK